MSQEYFSSGEQPQPTLTDKIRSLNLEEQAGFEKLNSFQIQGARWALTTIQVALGLGYLEPGNIRRVLDFGAGSGGPTFALKSVSEVIGADVEAVEYRRTSTKDILTSGILPQEKIFAGDGVEHIKSIDNRGSEKFDLVTAFMYKTFEQDERLPFRKFASALGKGLNPDGNLLMTSDVGTLLQVIDVLNESEVPYHAIEAVINNHNIILPSTLVIPAKSCARITYQEPTFPWELPKDYLDNLHLKYPIKIDKDLTKSDS